MNKSEIRKRVKYIEEKLETLNLALKDYDIQTKKFEKYKAFKTIERDCEEIIESAIKINQEISKKNDEVLLTYRESFDSIKNILNFNEREFEKLANSTGFRNRLAHDYMNLDERITILTAINISKIYPKYLLKILEFIETN